MQSINAGCYPDKDPGMSSLYVSGMPGKSVKETEKTYLNALKAFPSWLKDSDIERAKLYFLSANWSSLRDPNDLAEGLAEYTIKANNPMYFFNLTEKVQKVTRADILARWNEWSKRKQTRVLINPSKKSDPLKKR